MLLETLLRNLIKRGDLTLVQADGRTRRFVGPSIPGAAPVTLKLHDPGLSTRLALRPGLAFGEAYVDGSLTIESGTLYDFLAIASLNLMAPDAPLLVRVADRLPWRRLRQLNPVTRARRNVAHHYDLSEELYRRFLDADRQYSCAYFAHPGMSLEDAQMAKKRHLAAKLHLSPGQRVLDIGCGWGGLALYLARTAEVEVVGITLSAEQLAVARRRAAEAGLESRVRFELCDYRQVEGRFDRIVSVGMFEHVGVAHYRRFFTQVYDRLTEDGVAVLHSIGRSGPPSDTNAWLRKYIFPGGYSPAVSEVVPAVERSRLRLTDLEILRGHYAETLRHWRSRFYAERAEIEQLYDERFARMWDFYLTGSECAFRFQDLMVFQMQLAREAADLPITRDYMLDAERTRESWAAE